MHRERLVIEINLFTATRVLLRDNGALSKVLQPRLLFVTILRPMRKAYKVLNLL